MLVSDPKNIRLAMLGMVEGNGHPYSWSAIINGNYDAGVMAECGYPVIPQYLGAQPPEALGIPGSKVTHVWCDDPEDAEKVSRAAHIPHVVDTPEAVIGQVDAVIIATDIGGEHIERAKPFIDAGLPVFIDKPLTDNEADLQQFVQWQAEGKAILSSSCMRYADEFAVMRENLDTVGDLRLITVTMAKTWERYGIHALEAVYPFLSAGEYESVTHSGDAKSNIMRLRHASGVEVVLCVIEDLYGAFGHLNVYGTKGAQGAAFKNTFSAFKQQLESFVDYLRSGKLPFPFAETVEQMKIIIAGLESRAQDGKTIYLKDIKEKLE